MIKSIKVAGLSVLMLAALSSSPLQAQENELKSELAATQNQASSPDENISPAEVAGSVKMFNFKEQKYVYVRNPLEMTVEQGHWFIPQMDEAKTVYESGINANKKPLIAVLDTYKAIIDLMKRDKSE